jgi:hypothetical protein
MLFASYCLRHTKKITQETVSHFLNKLLININTDQLTLKTIQPHYIISIFQLLPELARPEQILFTEKAQSTLRSLASLYELNYVSMTERKEHQKIIDEGLRCANVSVAVEDITTCATATPLNNASDTHKRHQSIREKLIEILQLGQETYECCEKSGTIKITSTTAPFHIIFQENESSNTKQSAENHYAITASDQRSEHNVIISVLYAIEPHRDHMPERNDIIVPLNMLYLKPKAPDTWMDTDETISLEDNQNEHVSASASTLKKPSSESYSNTNGIGLFSTPSVTSASGLPNAFAGRR